MTLNAGLGDVSLFNQLLDAGANTNYTGHMIAIEDYVESNIKLLATRYTDGAPGTLEIIKFTFDQAISGAVSGETLLTLNSSYGANDLQLSPDGNNLAIYHFTGDDEGFGVRPAEALVYTMDDNYSPGPAPVSVIPVAEGTAAMTNAIFTADNNTLVISANSIAGQQLYAFNIPSASLQELPYRAGGNLRLENDGRIYASVAGTSTILAINTNLTTGFGLTLADTSLLTGHLAQPVFKVVPAGDINHALYARSAGLKKYELKDHLGNVRVVVSDRLTASGAFPNITNDAELLSYNHYYPFGMLQPGRNFAANTYRFGFNGKEMDNDWKGSAGTVYDYGFRIYDARVSRFLSVDPLTKGYPMLTPYQYASNRPIDGIDLDGCEFLKKGLAILETKPYTGLITNKNQIFINSDVLQIYAHDIIGKDFDSRYIINNSESFQAPPPINDSENDNLEPLYHQRNVKQYTGKYSGTKGLGKEEVRVRGYGTNAGTVVGGFAQLFVEIMETVDGYIVTDKEKMLPTIREHAIALNNAINLVNKASNSGILPSELNNPTSISHLTNYLVDFNINYPNSKEYAKMIVNYSQLLWNYKDEIMKGTYNTSMYGFSKVNYHSSGDIGNYINYKVKYIENLGSNPYEMRAKQSLREYQNKSYRIDETILKAN